jgi:UDP-N-acetylmuramate dehydrogenase
MCQLSVLCQYFNHRYQLLKRIIFNFDIAHITPHCQIIKLPNYQIGFMVSQNFSLHSFNTFHIDARARYFATFGSTEEINELLLRVSETGLPLTILGGGSNMLFTGDVNGWVLKNEITGITVKEQDDEYVYVQCGAGESWHRFVMYCIENNYAGVENLALIPGCTGASPMQNIGAYGVEIKDVFHELTAFNISEKANYTFTAKECEFGYRESVFKGKYKGQFIITAVTLRLRKKPVFNTSYGAIEQELERMSVTDLSIKAISDAVINIRSSKLPDPARIGNAGSFFKNPAVAKERFIALKQKFPGIIGYENPDGSIKLAAGWLIEQCGWKGYREHDAGVHEHQALVLVNYGHAKGSEIFDLSERILHSVQEKFNVTLEREVNIL